MNSSGPTGYEMSYALLCKELRRALVAAMQDGAGGRSRLDSVEVRATATLYGLLLAHPIDRRGRCRSCRRPGVVFTRRRCRMHIEAHFYFHQPTEFLLPHLRDSMGVPGPSPPAANGEAGLATFTRHVLDCGGVLCPA